MAPIYARILLSLLSVAVTAMIGCAKPHDNFHLEARPAEPVEPVPPASASALLQAKSIAAPSNVPRDWTPTKIDLTCAAPGGCPAQVGMLMFPLTATTQPNGNLLVESQRCTATLVGPDLILSAGHCDASPNPGFFLIGHGSELQVIRVRGVEYSRSSPSGADGKVTEFGPDVALFRLQSPVRNIVPLRLAGGAQSLYTQLIAYAVNESAARGTSDGLQHFRIDAITCTIHRHESYYPFDIQETPNVVGAFDCEVVHGNSGSPMFAPGSFEIQAVLQDVDSPTDQARRIRTNRKREPLPFELHWFVTGTNLRCLQLPDQLLPPPPKCTTVTSAEATRRFNAMINRPMPSSIADSFNTATEYNPVSYQMKAGVGTPSVELEVVYDPICRRPGAPLNEVTIPSQHVKLVYDIWGSASPKILETRLTTASVQARQGTRIAMATTWAPPFGPLLHEDQHPRQFWGNRFNIDLPSCAR